jgi:hypothetical protein
VSCAASSKASSRLAATISSPSTRKRAAGQCDVLLCVCLSCVRVSECLKRDVNRYEGVIEETGMSGVSTSLRALARCALIVLLVAVVQSKLCEYRLMLFNSTHARKIRDTVSKEQMSPLMLMFMAIALITLMGSSFYLGYSAKANKKSWARQLIQPVLNHLPEFTTPPRSAAGAQSLPPGIHAVDRQDTTRLGEPRNNAASAHVDNVVVKQLGDVAADAARLIHPGAIDVKHISQSDDAAVTRIAKHMKYWNSATKISRPLLWPEVGHSDDIRMICCL